MLNYIMYIPLMFNKSDFSIIGFISPTLGILTFRFKRIYYQSLGYFYCVKIGGTVYIYKQGMIGMIYLHEISYSSIEDLQFWIKNYLDRAFDKKIEKNKIKSEFKNWDGCLDLESKRGEN